MFQEHFYGKNVHIVSSPLMHSWLARLGSATTVQPQIDELVTMLYEHLFDVVIDECFPRKKMKFDTRMKDSHPEAILDGEFVDAETAAVSVGLARAGTLPSQLCYRKMNYLLNPQTVRQDHFYISRAVNEKNEVIGVTVAGSKIGGGVENAVVLFPDPMGATGSTIVEAVKHYRTLGKPKAMIALHLIITPEYLAKVTKECPELQVFALRLDRGLSPVDVLKEIPGKRWKEEKGLNSHHYIVPGAGGLGEILNNSYC
ncbi:MAG: uracil phosphoribosyltransferase [Bdellovibrionota bacterium]